MYLLEHMQNSLNGNKRSLALQLLRKPWACNHNLLVDHVPFEMATQFLKLQKLCKSMLEPPRIKMRFLQKELTGIHLYAYVKCPDGREFPLEESISKHAVEQFIGQINEDLAEAGISFHELPKSMQATFVALYSLAEACLYFLTGIIMPKHSTSSLTLTNDATILRAYKLYWFGHNWAFQSNFSDVHMRDVVVKAIKTSTNSLEQLVRLRTPIFISFVNASLDKYLSIHPGFSHLIDTKHQPDYSFLYRRAELISYLFLKSHDATIELLSKNFNPLSDVTIPFDYDIDTTVRAGFTQAEIDTLLAESSQQKSGDALLIMTSPGKFRLGNLNFKYACNVYLKPMLLGISTLGHWFDEKYIPAYLKDCTQNNRYSFGEEVQPKNRIESEGKYDIDLIVADHEMERIYLCQIKHRAATLLPYLRDELKEFSADGALTRASKQLDGARQQLSSAKFLEKVRDSLKRGGISSDFLSKIDTQFLQEETGFIIVHTIENLDFGLKNGIALYEWNTFRNLLSGSIHINSSTVNLDLSGVALDDPSHISDKLIKLQNEYETASDNPFNMGKQWALKKTSFLYCFLSWELKIFGRRIFSCKATRFEYPLL